MYKKIAAAVLILAMLAPLTGNAQSYYRSNNATDIIGANKVYLGIKFGQVSLELDTSSSDRESVTDNMGFVFGGHINDNLALEFEYTQTISSDLVNVRVSDGGGGFTTASVEPNFDTVGLFLVAKSTGTFYGKARLGYSWVEQDFDALGSDTVYGIAFGVGAGYKPSDTFLIEAEYTLYPEADETDRFGSAFGADLLTDIVSVNLVWSYN